MNDRIKLQFYASTPETCGYLPERQSISAFANPYMDMDVNTYNELIQFGFRRSGGYLYRPHCPDCKACISLRVPVNEYQLSRNDKRTLKKNSDLSMETLDAKYSDEHYKLYHRYINSRHKGGSMENPSKSDYHRFLICDWADTTFLEFRYQKKLVAVAVTDSTISGNSAVYTFFDPDHEARSLGHYAILKQIEYTEENALPYLYLGYWIEDCDKMKYKARYKPAEGFMNDSWIELQE